MVLQHLYPENNSGPGWRFSELFGNVEICGRLLGKQGSGVLVCYEEDSLDHQSRATAIQVHFVSRIDSSPGHCYWRRIPTSPTWRLVVALCRDGQRNQALAVSVEDANCLSLARLRVHNYPTRGLQPQPGTFSADPMPVDVSGCCRREPSSGAMTRPRRVRMSAIWSICAGQHSIQRHLDATVFGYVLVVTTSDVGVLALREPGRDWEGVAMLRGNKTLASMEFKATSPRPRRAGAQAKAMVLGPMRHFPQSAANIAVYLQGRCRCSFVWWVRKRLKNWAPGGQGGRRGMERMSRDGVSCRGTVPGRQERWLDPDRFGNFVRKETTTVRTGACDRKVVRCGPRRREWEGSSARKRTLALLGKLAIVCWGVRFPTSGDQIVGVFDAFQDAGRIIEAV